MIQRYAALLVPLLLISLMNISGAFSADEKTISSPTKPTFKLQQVTISATKTARDPIATPGEVSVIEQEYFQQRQAQSLDDVLRYEPGISSGDGPRQMGENPNIRGLSGARVLTLIDGQRLNFQSGHKGRTFIDVDLLKRVEIIRGPGSALYGSQAIGGVVAMETKDPSDYLGPNGQFAVSQKFGYQGASDELLTSTAIAGRLGEHFEVMAYGLLRGADDIRIGDGFGDLPNSGQDNSAGLGKIVWKPTAHDEAEFSVHVTRQAAGVPFNSNTNPTSAASLSDRKNRQFNYRLGYTHNNPDNPYLNLNGFVYHNTLDITERQLSNSTRDDINFDTTGFDLRNSMNFGDPKTHHHILTIGTEFYTNNQESRGNRSVGARLFFPKADSDVYGLYIQDEITLFDDRIVLIPGLRWDRWEKTTPGQSKRTANRVNPKIGTVVKATDFLYLTANYAHGFRQPGFDDLFVSGTHFPGSVFLPNPDLKPEKSRNIDAGVRVVLPRVLSDNDQLVWKGAYFRNKVRDFIDQDVNFNFMTFQLEFMPVNVTRALLQGFESEVTWLPTDNITVRGNFTYTRGKDLKEKEPLTQIPAIRGLLGIDYYHPSWGLTVGGRTQITGDQNRVPDGGGTEKTGGYALFDMYLAMEPPRSFFGNLGIPWLHGLRLNAGIDNLTDLKYRRHLSNLPEAGINPKVSLAYTVALP